MVTMIANADQAIVEALGLDTVDGHGLSDLKWLLRLDFAKRGEGDCADRGRRGRCVFHHHRMLFTIGAAVEIRTKETQSLATKDSNLEKIED